VTTRLTLVRHGESKWNVTGQVQGQSPEAGGLTERGFAQARATAEAIFANGTVVTRVVSSDLLRARQTAEVIAGALGVAITHDPSLREQALGDLEGIRFADSHDGVPIDEVIATLWATPTLAPPGGESVGALQARIVAALRRLAEPPDGPGTLVITHGGPVRVVRAAERPELLALGRTLDVANGSVTVVDVGDRLAVVISGDHGAGADASLPSAG
jgi:probable phosphoglycerate mutase